jgi:hypothetical protein
MNDNVHRIVVVDDNIVVLGSFVFSVHLFLFLFVTKMVKDQHGLVVFRHGNVVFNFIFPVAYTILIFLAIVFVYVTHKHTT